MPRLRRAAQTPPRRTVDARLPRLRHRRAALVATVAAVFLGALLASACAGLFETALRLDAQPRALAGAGIVVAPTEHAVLAAGDGRPAQQVTLTERGRLPEGVMERLRGLDATVRDATTGDVAAPGDLASPGVAAASRDVAPRDPASPAAALVVTVDGASAGDVRRRLAGLPVAVLAGDDRGRAEAVGVAGSRIKLVLFASIFGGLALMVMAILLASIISLAVEQRHRELALLRTIGATPAQVRRLVVSATLRPALIAALLGALAGPLLGRALFERVRSAGVVADVLALRQGPLTLVVGFAAALLIARISAGIAARKAGSVPLTEAIGEVEGAPGTVGPVRLALAGVMAAGAFSCAVVTLFMSPENAAATGGGTALAGALAFAFVAPALTDRLAGRLAPLAHRLAGFEGELAVANVRSRAGRTAALVIPVILVASVALANVYQQTTQAGAVRAALEDDLRPGAEHVVSAGWIEQPVDRSHRIDPWRLLGADPSALAARAASGSLADLRGNAVALPASLGLGVGETIGMVLGDGARVRLRVVAVLEGSSRNRSIILPAALLRAHGGEYAAGPQVDAWITFAVVGVIVAYAAMSLVNALVAALTGRRRELTLLRLAGATTGEVRRMLSAEALLVGAIGALAGTVVAFFGLVPLAIATAGSVVPSGPAWVFAAVLALIAALVLVPTLLVSRPVLRKLRVNDVEAA